MKSMNITTSFFASFVMFFSLMAHADVLEVTCGSLKYSADLLRNTAEVSVLIDGRAGRIPVMKGAITRKTSIITTFKLDNAANSAEITMNPSRRLLFVRLPSDPENMPRTICQNDFQITEEADYCSNLDRQTISLQGLAINNNHLFLNEPILSNDGKVSFPLKETAHYSQLKVLQYEGDTHFAINSFVNADQIDGSGYGYGYGNIFPFSNGVSAIKLVRDASEGTGNLRFFDTPDGRDIIDAELISVQNDRNSSLHVGINPQKTHAIVVQKVTEANNNRLAFNIFEKVGQNPWVTTSVNTRNFTQDINIFPLATGIGSNGIPWIIYNTGVAGFSSQHFYLLKRIGRQWQIAAHMEIDNRNQGGIYSEVKAFARHMPNGNSQVHLLYTKGSGRRNAQWSEDNIKSVSVDIEASTFSLQKSLVRKSLRMGERDDSSRIYTKVSSVAFGRDGQELKIMATTPSFGLATLITVRGENVQTAEIHPENSYNTQSVGVFYNSCSQPYLAHIPAIAGQTGDQIVFERLQ